MARAQSFDGRGISGDRRQARTKHGIDLENIRMVEQIEKFRNHVQVPGLTEWKVLQNAEIHIDHGRILKRVSAKSERSGRERESMGLIGIEAR